MSNLTKGIVGLVESRKGILCLIMFFCSIIPMTILCFLGRLDGTSYAICMSALTTAVVAVFCHTQSQTDQAAMTAPPLTAIVNGVESIIGSGPPVNLPGAHL